MTIRHKLKRFRGQLLNFNQFHRDEWVAARAAEIPAETMVLDVGAGRCRYRALFAHCRYWAQDFCGLDAGILTYSAIDVVSDAASLPMSSASFDVVLCTEVLEHVPNPIEVVREISRVLRPGGWLVLTAPLGSGLHQVPYHYYGGYTPYWYEFFLPRFGFGNISIEPNGGFFKHYGQETARILTFLFPHQSQWWWRWLRPLFAVPLCYVVPALCHILDPIDKERRFTTGYFVKARKQI